MPAVDPPPPTWAAWWGAHDVLDDPASADDAQAFVAASDRLVGFRPEDDVLDVGCGGGFVLERLAPRVRSAVGLDVSERQLVAARGRLAHQRNVSLVPLDSATPAELTALGDRRFSVVLCHSVVQYLPSLGDVDALFRSIHGHVVPGGRVLVSDLSTGGGRLSDAWGLVRAAWRRGRPLEAWRRVRRLRRGTYAATRERLGLLAVDPERLVALARSLGGTAEVVDAPLSMLANRRHVLARF